MNCLFVIEKWPYSWISFTLITVILASLLVACSSQKTVSERSLLSDTHKISYGSGGKIVRGNPEKKETELKIVDRVTVTDSETSKTLPGKRFSIKYQSKKRNNLLKFN